MLQETVPFDLANYPTTETIRLLSSLLEKMTLANDILNTEQQKRYSLQQQPTYTRFHAKLIPSIDIYSYLTRILKYCPCTNECFLSLLVYFDRMSKNSLKLTGKPFTIDSYNIHRLIIAGIMVACKFFSDIFYTNTRYAKVGGLPVKELNSLEIEFLKLNGFNLNVSINELQKYGDQLLKYKHNRSFSLDNNAYYQHHHQIRRSNSLNEQKPKRFWKPTYQQPQAQPPQQYYYYSSIYYPNNNNNYPIMYL